MHILTGFMFELYQHSAWDISTEYIPVVTSLVCNLTEQHGVHIKEASVAEHNIVWWEIPLVKPWKCHFQESKYSGGHPETP